jgi:predicted methyltransferase
MRKAASTSRSPCPTAACSASVPTGFSERSLIAAAVADPARLDADRERDGRDRPAEVLAFLGIAPGMRALDLNAATGYYAELLARVVGPTGRVIAHNHPGAHATLAPADFEARYGNRRLQNVEQLFARHDDLHLPSQSLDAVLMSMVYHDMYWLHPDVDWGPVDRAALLAEIYDALVPGGIVGVIDHFAAAGVDPRVSAMATHRIDPAVVRRDFAAAGFELAGESDALRNTADSYSLGVFDERVHGHTDRFVLAFRRPWAAGVP